MTRRPGVTLTEVLIAMFIATIGLLSLLTLFPAGMQNMAQAIQDTRAGHSKQNAMAMFYVLSPQDDPWVDRALHNPPGAPPIPKSSSTRYPSYAVLVDPVGWYGLQSPEREWVGRGYADPNNPNQRLGVPRVTLKKYNDINDPATRRRAILEDLTFLDDITFVNNPKNPQAGTPEGTLVDRGGEYTYAYLLQKTPLAQQTVLRLHVLVYRDRTVQLTQNRSLFNEPTFDARFLPLDNGFLIDKVPGIGAKPPFARGEWVIDSTVDTRNWNPNNPQSPPPEAYGHPYKIATLTPLSPDSIFVEVETPLFESRVYGNRTRDGKITVLKNVIDIFDMGTIGTSGRTRPANALGPNIQLR